MKKLYLIILIIIITLLVMVIYNKPLNQKEATEPFPEKTSSEKESKNLELPIKKTGERVIKKPFGIKISPENSPISPERFSGYHTGVDYEIFEGEENIDVQVFAICSGELLKKENRAGYGGILVQECKLENQPVTVLYGHIKLSSVQQNIGDYISKGYMLAVLGGGFSQETNGERKHLHLGIHKGTDIDIRGYVQNESELKDWIDFETHQSTE
jgi:hypothetical protein